MHNPITVFNQLLHLLPRSKFDSVVHSIGADKYSKNFNCWQQLITLLFAQATGKDSLREIETGLRCNQKTWYHLGLDGVSKSNLAYANKNRPCEIFESLFYALLERTRNLLPNQSNFKFKNDIKSLDSTTISLCLSLFPWAKYRQQKGAFKLHTLFDVKTQIPELVIYSDANQHDMRIAKNIDLLLSSDSILVMDRAYIDYEWLYSLHCQNVFFVVRAKKNMQHVVLGQHQLHHGGSPTIAESGIQKDEIIELVLPKAEEKYPEKIRKITYYDEKQDKTYIFLTNNFEFSAKTIADIYKSRWQIELFFKWIKQNLKIKTFLGTSKNAVLTQIWVAMIYYLILAYIKAQTKTSLSKQSS